MSSPNTVDRNARLKRLVPSVAVVKSRLLGFVGLVTLLLRLFLDLAKQIGHRGSQGRSKLLDDENRWHPLAPLQQADVVAMQPRLRSGCLLRQVRRLPSSPQNKTESSLKWMHG